ncbi:uncharacterized protein LOC106153417 [Lingula anatina]|uniref:Uncharacterized protein LOC106153417 n=1 Tax=Lingula anatina TaxID=7574 RepID=A0A1S3HBC6_LINAN|nr:uncharacterized protein LOC106153417 [Lingula anatina]XP_013382796.1 uncharacterized protein LOC106153417 [Lingula anatina]XP_013382797.1 uncharacterized protein LOC106153417 [Lingula anatina]|eukprot:XP_013382795.1 uncharacterized protein LOC106153417 [Lingula anatina]
MSQRRPARQPCLRDTPVYPVTMMAAARSFWLQVLSISLVWCLVIPRSRATDDIYYMDSESFFNGCNTRNLIGEIPVYERDTLVVKAWSSRAKSINAPYRCTLIFQASGGHSSSAETGYGLRVRIVNLELPINESYLVSEIVFKEHPFDSDELRRFDRQHRGEITDVFTRSRYFTIGLSRRGSVDYNFDLTVSRTSVYNRYMDNTSHDCGKIIDVGSTQVEFVHAWKVSRNQANHEGTCSITFRNADPRRLEVAFQKLSMGSCTSSIKFYDGLTKFNPQLRSVTCLNSALPLTTTSLGSSLTVVLNANGDDTFDFLFTVAPVYIVSAPPIWGVTPTPGDSMTYFMDNTERQCQRPYTLPVYSSASTTLVGNAFRLPRNQTKIHFCLMTFQTSDVTQVIRVFFARFRISSCNTVLSVYAERTVPVRTEGVSLLYRVTCENYHAFTQKYVFSTDRQLTFVLSTLPGADFHFAIEMRGVARPDPLLPPPAISHVTVYLDDFTSDCGRTFEVDPDTVIVIKAWGQDDPNVRRIAPYACNVRMRSSALYAGRGKLKATTSEVDIPCTSAATLFVYDSINSVNAKMRLGSQRCNSSAQRHQEIVSSQPYLKLSLTRTQNSIDFNLELTVKQTQTVVTVSPIETDEGISIYYMDGYGDNCNKTHVLDTGKEIQIRAWSHEGRVGGGACAMRFIGNGHTDSYSIFWVQFPSSVHFPGQGCSLWMEQQFSKLILYSNNNSSKTVLQCMSIPPSELYSHGELTLLLKPESKADYDFTFNIKHVQAPMKPTRAMVTQRPSPLAITAGGISGIVIGSVILLVAIVVVVGTVRRGECQRVRASWQRRCMRAAGTSEGVQVSLGNSELYGLPRYEDLQFTYKQPPPPYSGKGNEGYQPDEFIAPPPYTESMQNLQVCTPTAQERRSRYSSMQELRELAENDMTSSVTLPLPRDAETDQAPPPREQYAAMAPTSSDGQSRAGVEGARPFSETTV